ncbi:hypothetical protein AOLI_G00035540 [Acnodon oligacanthus]
MHGRLVLRSEVELVIHAPLHAQTCPQHRPPRPRPRPRSARAQLRETKRRAPARRAFCVRWLHGVAHCKAADVLTEAQSLESLCLNKAQVTDFVRAPILNPVCAGCPRSLTQQTKQVQCTAVSACLVYSRLFTRLYRSKEDGIPF